MTNFDSWSAPPELGQSYELFLVHAFGWSPSAPWVDRRNHLDICNSLRALRSSRYTLPSTVANFFQVHSSLFGAPAVVWEEFPPVILLCAFSFLLNHDDMILTWAFSPEIAGGLFYFKMDNAKYSLKPEETFRLQSAAQADWGAPAARARSRRRRKKPRLCHRTTRMLLSSSRGTTTPPTPTTRCRKSYVYDIT